MVDAYDHGYDAREAERLRDQADALVDLLHHDTAYPAGDTVLEMGCGVGAQTVTLARRSPGARIVSIDLAAPSLAIARQRADLAGAADVVFAQADLFAPPFAPATFNHVFVCFVLEHLRAPGDALAVAERLLKPGGTLTVIEGDHGSTTFHPDDAAAREAISSLETLQRAAGGDPHIGRRLYPLLHAAGFDPVRVTPRFVYVDASRPALVEGFTLNTFTAMVAGVRDAAIRVGLSTAARFDEGLGGLRRAARPDGVFCYTFFKGVGIKPIAA